MGKKIKLSHEEVDIKLFLEVLGVYAVLAFVLIGIYYLEPAITGFVTVTKQLNYTDDVNFAAEEDNVFVWNLVNPGNLKSVKIDGSLIGNGSVRVYIEHENIRYLVLDSSKLVEKESGLFGITGFAVSDEDNNEQEEDDRGDIGGANESEEESDESEENGDGDESEEEEEGEEEDDDISINGTPIINETIINETAEKIIDINLEYGDNEIYDANNDGTETLSGVIDFSIADTEFNWDVDENKLCSRYEVFSVEIQESSFACYGSNECCNLIGLESSRDLWDENLFLSYGTYGSTESNIVFAQVIYADYDLSPENPYSDVAYSRWSNLTAEFIEGIEFEDVCLESCVFKGNETSYNIIVEVENAELRINRINYIIEEKVPNNAPELAVEIENLTITKNRESILDLKKHFADADGDGLIYSYSEAENIAITFEDDAARIIPDENFTGTRLLFITASDLYDETSSNVFKVDVVDTGIELLDVQKKDNITVSFLTYGSGNLTIKAADGSYSEFFNDDIATADDMEIIELRCNDFEVFDKNELIETNGLWFILENGSRFKMDELVQESVPLKSVLVEDYSCGGTSYLTAKVLGGSLAQEIKFGNYTIIADISDVIAGNTFEIRNNEDSKLVVFDSFGNAAIRGNLSENITGVNDGNDFMIQDPDGTINMLITNPEGNMLMRGFLNENQSILVPGINSFIVEDSLGDIVAYVDANGNLFLKGVIEENALFG